MINTIITAHEFHGEPAAQIWTPSMRLSKTAYSTDGELQTFLDKIKPSNDVAFVLCNAMGAFEYFGLNANKDGFFEAMLLENYKTFERGHTFTQHVNKDPSKARGTIPLALYNGNMHRVELVLRLPTNQNSDILTRIERMDPVGVSMGVKVRADKCSWCGNVAPTRNEYCKHIRNNLGWVREDGTQCGMINLGPAQFFDLSIVRVPADKTGWVMKKVAYTGGPDHANMGDTQDVSTDPAAVVFGDMVDDERKKQALRDALNAIRDDLPPSVKMADLAEKAAGVKVALVRKVADIDKEVPGEVVPPVMGLSELYAAFRRHGMPKLRESEPHAPVVGDLKADGALEKMLATLAGYGIILTPGEFQRYLLQHKGRTFGNLGDALHDHGATFEYTAPKNMAGKFPDLKPNMIDHGFMDEHEELFAPKSYFRGGILSRLGDSQLDPSVAPKHRSSDLMGENWPSGTREILSETGGLYNEYKQKAKALAMHVADGAHRFFPNSSVVATLSIKPHGFIADESDDTTLGIPKIAFGAPIHKVAREVEARLAGGFNRRATVKLANHYLNSGMPVNEAPGLIGDIWILNKMGLL